MDAALRQIQRDGDRAREAIVEHRAGRGIAGWLDTVGERGAHCSDRLALTTALNTLDPAISQDAESRNNWVRVFGAAHPVIVVRVADLVVVSFIHAAFPEMNGSHWMEAIFTIDHTKNDTPDESYARYEVHIGRPKSTIKDQYAREAYDKTLGRVTAWASKLHHVQGAPANVFTLEA